jgi:ABC-type uncharacterized transport system substrate-binding protein
VANLSRPGGNVTGIFVRQLELAAKRVEIAREAFPRATLVGIAFDTLSRTAAQRATTIIPIVIVGISDPVGTGLVGSLARPGGNITGLGNFARDLSGKLVEILVEIVPGITSLAALANPDNPTAHPLLLRETEVAVHTLGVRLQTLDVRVPDELDGAFWRMAGAGAKGVVVLPDPLFLRERRKVAELAQKARLPTEFARRENVDAGGLCLTGRTCAINSAKRPSTQTGFSAVRRRPNCRSSSRHELNSSSTSRPRRRLASSFLRRCSPAPTG